VANPGAVGNLYVSVGANVYPAIKAMRRLDKEVRRTKQSIQTMGARSSGTNKLTKDAKKAGDQLNKTSKAGKKAAKGVKQYGDAAKNARSATGNLVVSTKRLSEAFVNLRYGNPLGVFAGLTQGAGSMGAAFGKAGGAAAALKVGLVALAAAPVAVGAAFAAAGAKIAQFGLQEATNLEMLQLQYEGLLQSAERGAAEVDYILNLGRTSMVPTEGLLEANRLLLAYGVTADDTRQSLIQFFSDFGSATGLSAARLQDMAYALGQVNTQGKANAIDLRQLANAGLNLKDVYAKIAEQQSISVSEARALTSEGKLTADILTPAILALGDSYEETAKKARDTTKGILVNLKDTAKINVGKAFEDALAALKPLLKWVRDFVEAFDFSKIARAFENVIEYFREAFHGMLGDAKETSTGISDTIAKSLNIIGYVAANVAAYIRAVLTTVKMFVNAIWALIQVMVAEVLQHVTGILDVIVTVSDKVRAPWAASMRDMALSSRTMFEEVREGSIIAKDQMIKDGAQAARAWRNVLGGIKYRPIGSGITTYNPGGGAYDTPVEEDPLPELDTDLGGGGSSTPKEDPLLKKWQDWLQALKDLIKAIKEAKAEIRGLTEMRFGEASELQKALDLSRTTRGENGLLAFEKGTGSVSSVISFYDKAAKAVRNYYQVQIDSEVTDKKTKRALRAARARDITDLKSYTQELVNLANKQERLQAEIESKTKKRVEEIQASLESLESTYNSDVAATEAYYDNLIAGAESALERATEAYEAANEKLQQMIEARDSFLNSIMESARSFVNGLSLASETITKITELDGVGSFAYTEEQKTQDFKTALQERLTALREWVAGVKQLRSQGLDRALLEQLIAAGPSGSADVVQQLAGMGSGGIAEVNAIQGEMSALVGGLQSELADAWFNQGISQQQAYVQQQLAAKQAAEANLASLRAAREQALADLESEYNRRKELLQDQLTAVQNYETEWQQQLMGQLTETAKKAETQAQLIHDKLSALSDPEQPEKNLQTVGVQALRGLLKGLDKMTPRVLNKARAIADAVRMEIVKALRIHSPSRVMMDIGEHVGDGMAIGMDSALPKVEAAALRMAGASLPNIDGGGPAAPEVRVFIGDQELRDIVDVQIVDASRMDREFAVSGRRVN